MADSLAAENSIPIWTCSWRDPISQPAETPQVGDLLRLTCEGAEQITLGTEAQVQTSEEEKHILKIIEVKNASPGKIDLAVTSYMTGEFKDKSFVVSDGILSFRTSPLNYVISSVLPPNEKTEPYPAFGPFSLSYPYWIWILLGVILVVLTTPVILKLRKRRQKMQLLAATDIQQKEQTIEHDVAKFYRQQRRELENTAVDVTAMRDKIELTAREYLTVRFKVPAFVWSRQDIARDIRKHHKKMFEEIGVPLNKLIYEIESSQNSPLDLRGAEQLLEDFRSFTEKCETLLKSRRK